jgi:serine/threonine-protein phosphatase 6 regulatory ankyrin repeat subunit A
MRMLLAAGVDVEARDRRQETALHHAAREGDIEAAREFILEHNANMFVVDRYGETPFDFACSMRSSNAVNSLLEMYGSKMNQDEGHLALHAILHAANYSFPETGVFHPPLNPPLQIILPMGTLTLKHWRTLLQSLDIELIRNRDDSGKLPIHIGCLTNSPVEILSTLVELDSATLQIADHSGALPLHECCRGIVDYSSVLYLVEQGGVGTLAARNNQGELPLHVLCASTNPQCRSVQCLIQSSPRSVTMRTNAGEYPFMMAACETSTASLNVVYELVRVNPDLVVPRSI